MIKITNKIIIQKYIVIEDTVKICPPPKSNYNPKLNHSFDRNMTK